MTEQTYNEHMAEMLRLGGAHECASDCPLPLPRRDPRADQIPTAEQPTPEQELRCLRFILPILERMHPATIRWLIQRLEASRG